MAKVSNVSTNPLVVGNVMVPPGGSAEVPDEEWTTAQESAIVQQWMTAGALHEGDPPEPRDAKPEEERVYHNRMTEEEAVIHAGLHGAVNPEPTQSSRDDGEGGGVPPPTEGTDAPTGRRTRGRRDEEER